MALAAFSQVDRTTLRWLRTSEKPTGFTLSSGDTPVATLLWARHGGSLATATVDGASWTLKRSGFLAPLVTAREAGATAPLARLSAHLRRHDIRIRGAPPYALHHVSHLLPSWQVSADDGTEVLHIEPVAEHRELQGGAVVVSARSDAPETLLLIVVSWYFIVLSWLEDELVEALAPFEGPDAPASVNWDR